MGKVLSARQTILCLLSFQGYPPILEAVRFLQRYHKDRWNQSLWKKGCIKFLFRLSIRAKRRTSHEETGAKDPLADLPFWLEDFTDNLEPTEVHAPAHISQDSELEHPAKVYRVNTVFLLPSRKTEIATSA